MYIPTAIGFKLMAGRLAKGMSMGIGKLLALAGESGIEGSDGETARGTKREWMDILNGRVK